MFFSGSIKAKTSQSSNSLGNFCLQKIFIHRGMSYVAINCLHVVTTNLPVSCISAVHDSTPFPSLHSKDLQAPIKELVIPPDMWTFHKYSEYNYNWESPCCHPCLGPWSTHPRALAVGSKEGRWWGATGNTVLLTPRITYAQYTQYNIQPPAPTKLVLTSIYKPIIHYSSFGHFHTKHIPSSQKHIFNTNKRHIFNTDQIFCRWTKKGS